MYFKYVFQLLVFQLLHNTDYINNASVNKYHFYRATLCVSARSFLWSGVRPSVCLSVCPSVTFVHSIQTAEDIVKLLCRPGSRIILVF